MVYGINSRSMTKKIKKRFVNFVNSPLATLRRVSLFLVNKLRYREYHLSCIVLSPLEVTPAYISLGPDVCIGKLARIEGVTIYNGKRFTPNIIFRQGCTVQQGLHLTCANSVVIGKNTAIAAYVTITDIHHPYDDVTLPIERQDIDVSEVVIGDDCKIYNGAVITPGVHIGKHVTIGANAVVTCDIPDYSVAVGAPAHVVKSYNFKTKQWERSL